MSKTVVKFGGSNLKCKEDIGRVIQVVKNYEKPIIIVVSAFYGVTNKLKGSGVGAKPEILTKVTTALHVAGINIRSVLTSQISINILIAKKDLNTAYAVVSAIELPVVGRLQIAENIAVPP